MFAHLPFTTQQTCGVKIAVVMGRGEHSRITVGNLSYNATEEELQTEMEKYGKVVSARIPRRRSGRSKGIGIVDFETGEEADKAYEQLHGKDLFGRTCYIGFDDRVEERDRLSRRSRDRYDDRDRSSRRRRRRSDYSDYDYSDDRQRRRYRDRDDRDRYDRDRDYSRSRRRDRGRRERRSRYSDSDDYR